MDYFASFWAFPNFGCPPVVTIITKMYRKLLMIVFSGLLLIFLTHCTEKEPENTAPLARFTVSSNTGTIETLFTFDASASSDLEDSASQLRIRWDWEDDGRWDTDYSTEKILKRGFQPIGFYKVTMEVADTKGLTSKYTEIVNVEDYYLVDTRDNQEYKTVKIGTQLWMAENLNFNAFEGSYCHGDNPDNCQIYGRLYEWASADFACPSGWHLPTNDDWDLLTDYLGENNGVKLKSDFGWTGDYNGDNSSGFNALPASYHTEYGEYMALGGYAFFWTATENQENRAWSRLLSYNREIVEKNFFNKQNAFSVRCLKN